MTWTLPPRQWRTRVRPSKTRADYLCEYIFSKFTARLPRRVTPHINNGAVFAQPLPEAAQRPSLLGLPAQWPGQFQRKNALAQRPGRHQASAPPLRSTLYQGRYAAFCVWACHKWSDCKRDGRKRRGPKRPARLFLSRTVLRRSVTYHSVLYRSVPPGQRRSVQSRSVTYHSVLFRPEPLSPVPAPPTRRAL